MLGGWLKSLHSSASRSEDIAAAVFFRFAFGLTTCFWAWDYLASGRVSRLYVAPVFHFKYPLLEFVEPLPGEGMYLFFLWLLVLSLLIAVGWFYRIASVAFAVSFTYFFLIERTNYQNHYYLICLISWCLPWLPLNRDFSVDSRSGRVASQEYVPNWVYWLLRFYIGVPYFFGGVAKLTTDWLQGQPMELFLSSKSELPLIGGMLQGPFAVELFSWGGLFFDLAIVPMLLWSRSRWLAYCLCVGFHITNSFLFQIHIFPWFMILATTVFFPPSWPRQLLGVRNPDSGLSDNSIEGDKAQVVTSLGPWWSIALIGLALFHCAWPLRSRLYNEETSWTERGHLFSWRMMLRAKEVGIGYAIVDPTTGRVANVDHKQFIDAEQAEKFARDPELIRQLAHFIATKFEKEMGRRPEVYALVLASLNGRKPQLMIDPNVDLATQPFALWEKPSWILPLTEPFRKEAWRVPIDQWKSHVDLPPIKFLERMKALQKSRENDASKS